MKGLDRDNNVFNATFLICSLILQVFQTDEGFTVMGREGTHTYTQEHTKMESWSSHWLIILKFYNSVFQFNLQSCLYWSLNLKSYVLHLVKTQIKHSESQTLDCKWCLSNLSNRQKMNGCVFQQILRQIIRECRKSGWECGEWSRNVGNAGNVRNKGGNAGNGGGHAGNQGGKAGNQGGNAGNKGGNPGN